MSFSIAMFPNEDKQPGTKAPDYKGWNKETGENIAAWWKTARNGTEYLSVKVETAEDRQRGRQQVQRAIERPSSHAAQRKRPQNQTTEEWLDDYNAPSNNTDQSAVNFDDLQDDIPW